MAERMNTFNVAYASNEQTLEDYLKSDVCSGREVYCAFEPANLDSLYYQGWLIEKMKKIGIKKINFLNRHSIRNESQ